MCQKITIRKFGACNHTVEIPDQREQLCLFGEHCGIVNHTYRVFQRRDKELCPDCKVHEAHIQDMTEGGFTLNLGKAPHAGNNTNFNTNTDNASSRKPAHERLPATTRALLNNVAQERLRAYLTEDLSAGQCKSLEHFVLQQPGVVSKGPLIDIFGEGAGGWYSDAVERDFVTIAAKKRGAKGFRERMEKALARGRELREDERRAAAELEAEEKKRERQRKRKAGKAAAAHREHREEEKQYVVIGKEL
ncbi:hypothetical protein F5X99DRAFT_428377 [Biscogniauxia marginata]|nr:hypothetical protein F5X99DRAFT_428377 [Biscogniauxia marginata]